MLRSDFVRTAKIIMSRTAAQQLASPGRVLKQMEEERSARNLRMPKYIQQLLKANKKKVTKDASAMEQSEDAGSKQPRMPRASHKAKA